MKETDFKEDYDKINKLENKLSKLYSKQDTKNYQRKVELKS